MPLSSASQTFLICFTDCDRFSQQTLVQFSGDDWDALTEGGDTLKHHTLPLLWRPERFAVVDSLCASKNGLKYVDQARRRKRWNKTAEVWCSAALTSRATLSRFWAGHPIRSETFISICEAVGVDWQQVVSPHSQPHIRRETQALLATPSVCPTPNLDERLAAAFSSSRSIFTSQEPASIHTAAYHRPTALETSFPISDIHLCLPFDRPSTVAPKVDVGVHVLSEIQHATVHMADTRSDRHDWGTAPAADRVWGRTQEDQQLQTWILTDRCRWVGLFGMGGIGKTTLAAQFARAHADRFERVIWRSLSNAPSLDDLITDLLAVLALSQAPYQSSPMSLSLETKVQRLLNHLQQHRCLLIFDNVESLLQAGDRTGRYRDGYDAYGFLFRCIGETPHQSCMLITSRERLKDQCCLEGKNLPVRCLQLEGLPLAAAQAVVEAKGDFRGNAAEWHRLITHYSGNPLALQIVASTIRDTFSGRLDVFLDFLHHNPLLFDDICMLINQQFDRLSDLEQHIMYQLAIHREPASLQDLQDDKVCLVAAWELMQAIATLQRRSLIETSSPASFRSSASDAGFFQAEMPRLGQQPVVMQVVTWRLIQHMTQDLLPPSSCPSCTDSEMTDGCFRRYVLVKAQAKDYIREAQYQLIVIPLMQQLTVALGSQPQLESFLMQQLNQWRTWPHEQIGYGGSNVIHLLRQMQVDLSGKDFSHLPLWQADLRGLTLNQVNLTGCDLSETRLTQAFGSVVTLAFSPDGQLLASGDGNGEVQIWRVADGQLLSTLRGHTQWIQNVAFSPDGSLLASASDDQTIRLWHMPSNAALQVLQGHRQSVRAIAFTPNGHHLISGSSDQTLRLWNVQTGQIEATFQPGGESFSRSCERDSKSTTAHAGTIWSICVSRDGRYLVSGGSDRVVRLWDLSSRQLIHTLEGHQGWIWSVDISPDSRWVASASDDCTVALWDRQTGLPVHWFRGHTQAVRAVRFYTSLQPRGDADLTSAHDAVDLPSLPQSDLRLVSGSDDRTLRIWQVHSRQALKPLVGHDSAVWAIAISPDGAVLASGSTDPSIRLWCLRRDERLHTLQGSANWVLSVAAHASNPLLASGGVDSSVRLWHAHTGHLVACLSGHRDWVWSVAFSPDGTQLASASDDGTLRLWNLDTAHCQTVLAGHSDWVMAVAFSPDGLYLASGGADQTVRLWNAETGYLLHTFIGHTDWVRSLAFHPNRHTLYSGSEDGTVRCWHINDGPDQLVLTHPSGGIRAIALSPNGHQLASASDDGSLYLWNSTSDRPPQLLQGHVDAILSVAFSPDGHTLATASADHTLRLWNSYTGELQQTLRGHTQAIQSVAFSGNGQSLISGGKDCTLRQWNLPSGHCQRVFKTHQPYDGMNITDVTGLSDAQRNILHSLGAIAPQGQSLRRQLE